jgi:predicted enzyme related to lactoylglutathione lyase
MDQRISFITLGVKNMKLMSAFYKEMFGWNPHKEIDDIVFFKMNGFILALYPSEELAKDAHIQNSGSGWKQFSFSINFYSTDEIDQEIHRLKNFGVKILKEPQTAFWGGYSAYVEDPESNVWEFAYNPFLEMDQDGNVLLHQ